jgi:hypothetical protein
MTIAGVAQFYPLLVVLFGGFSAPPPQKGGDNHRELTGRIRCGCAPFWFDIWVNS